MSTGAQGPKASILDVTQTAIGGNEIGVALVRITVATAAGRAQHNEVTLREDVLRMGVHRLAVDLDSAGCSRHRAVETWRRIACALGHEQPDQRPIRSRLKRDLLAEATALAAGAA